MPTAHAGEVEAVTLHVAPGGNAQADGSADSPFGTIAHAQRTIRKARAADKISGPVVVLLHPGTYFLEEPIKFTPEDSGTADHPVTYRSTGKGEAILSGGRLVSGWKPGKNRLWVAQLEPELDFRQLFVDGRRRPRARTPNFGYFRTDGPLVPAIPRWFASPEERRQGSEGFRIAVEDLPHWTSLDDLEVNVFHQWSHTKHWVKELDPASRAVFFTNRFHWDFGYWENRQRYYLENSREALDSPGEWYYDRRDGKLYYWPIEGESPETLQAIYPVIDRLIDIAGEPENGRFVERIHFEGLSLRHAGWSLSRREYQAFAQANDMLKHAVIPARGLQDATIKDCEIAHFGQHGIWLQKGCRQVTIERCHLHDGGAGGIYLGEGGWGARGKESKDPNQRTGHIRVENNYIHHMTQVFHGAVGLWIGSSSHNRVRHNEISDMDYMGINVGWCWDDRPSAARDNLIEKNYVHHIARAVLTDTAGIYTLGVSPETVIRANVVHDVFGYPYHAHAHGLYNDQGSSEIVMEGNLVYRTSHAGYNRNHGRDLLVRNNIFADYGDAAMSVGKKGENLRIERNIFYGQIPQMITTRGSDDYRLKNNLYWNTHGPVRFFDMTPQEWMETGKDEGSLVARPRFVAPAHYDFRLKDDSPARQLGFEELRIADVGLQGDPAWVELPRKTRREPLDVPPPPSRKSELEEDFEDYLSEEEVPFPEFPLDLDPKVELNQVIHVTRSEAASGKKSLKLVDEKSPHSFLPSLKWEPSEKKGYFRFTCDFQLDADRPGILWIDFRDDQVPEKSYVSGPSIKVLPTGEVEYRGKSFATIEPGKWNRLILVFGTEGAEKKSTVSVESEDGEKTVLEDQYIPEMFDSLGYIGIYSLANEEAVIYLDNLHLDLREATAGPASPQKTPTSDLINILPLGDSITQGGRKDRPEYTYRYPLFYMLADAGYPVDFIGSMNEGLHADARWPSERRPPFDLDHEGHYGWKTGKVAEQLAGWMESYPAPPDIALIHLGTNDQKAEDYEAAIIRPLEKIVRLLREANPEVVILIGHLNFNGGAALEIRPLVEEMTERFSTEASPVETVDHFEGWKENPGHENTDTFDWAHPNPKGQRKMAEKWFEAMSPHLKRVD